MFEVDESNPLADSCTEFGLYLNVSGAAEAASNALLNLFMLDEKPDNAVEWIRETLDKRINKELERLKTKVETARDELTHLKDVIVEIRNLGLKLHNEDEASDDDSSQDGDEQNPNQDEANNNPEMASLETIETDEKIESANVNDETK